MDFFQVHDVPELSTCEVQYTRGMRPRVPFVFGLSCQGRSDIESHPHVLRIGKTCFYTRLYH